MPAVSPTEDPPGPAFPRLPGPLRFLVRFTTRFIGAGGILLKETTDSPAVYDVASDVGYVRAKVVDSMGWVAWTQPLFVQAR